MIHAHTLRYLRPYLYVCWNSVFQAYRIEQFRPFVYKAAAYGASVSRNRKLLSSPPADRLIAFRLAPCPALHLCNAAQGGCRC